MYNRLKVEKIGETKAVLFSVLVFITSELTGEKNFTNLSGLGNKILAMLRSKYVQLFGRLVSLMLSSLMSRSLLR